MTDPQVTPLPDGTISHRDNGSPHAVSHVLLHGIGSNANSWQAVLNGASSLPHRWVAWDAPGYGSSTALPSDRPSAQDYAHRLWSWLDNLEVHEPVTLVGHSLGALMAAAAARSQPQRVKALMVLSPALGYAHLSPAEQEQLAQKRLHLLQTQGPAAMAKQRAQAMLSAHATPAQLQAVEMNMARVQLKGYTQAVHMLMAGHLQHDLQMVQAAGLPIHVACGRDDAITPMAQTEAFAHQLGLVCADLGPIGHACAIEAPDQVLDLILRVQERP